MLNFFVKKLFEDARPPVKKNPRDSGWDVFVHGFRAAYIAGQFREEAYEEVDSKTGILVMDAITGAVESAVLNPGDRVVVGTGIAGFVQDPADPSRIFELQARPRSGLARFQGITVVNSPGTIDDPYRGEIGIIICNSGNQAVTIKIGDKIAQLVPMEILPTTLVHVEVLPGSDRGADGYGSSGNQ